MAVEEIYLYPEDYDLEVESRGTNDIPFWIHLLQGEQPVPARILEIGCGTGRLTIPLAREGAVRGFTIVGLDIEPAMLSRAQERMSHEPEYIRNAVQLVLGDVRSLDMGECFDVILMPYGIAHHLISLNDQLASLRNVSKHLKAGGLLAIDIQAPDVTFLARALAGLPGTIDLDIHKENGHHLCRSQLTQYAQSTQLAVHDYSYDVTDAKGMHRHYQSPFAMHVYYPREMELLLRLTGFRLERFIGSYTNEPFTDSSSLMITLARSLCQAC
jgi:ubiquinone/menaquinone biosynthesis C-methylase UbiE